MLLQKAHLLDASLSASAAIAAAGSPFAASEGCCCIVLPSLLLLLLLLLLLVLLAVPGGSCWYSCWGAAVAAHVSGVLMPTNVTGPLLVCKHVQCDCEYGGCWCHRVPA